MRRAWVLGLWRGQRTKSSKPGMKSQNPRPDPAGHLGPEGTATTPVGQLQPNVRAGQEQPLAFGLWAHGYGSIKQTLWRKAAVSPGGGAPGLWASEGAARREPTQHPRARAQEQGPRRHPTRHTRISALTSQAIPTAKHKGRLQKRRREERRGFCATATAGRPRPPGSPHAPHCRGGELSGAPLAGESPLARPAAPAGRPRFPPDGVCRRGQRFPPPALNRNIPTSVRQPSARG